MAGNIQGPIDSSDIRANAPEYIEHAAQYLKKSPQRRSVFAAIYKKQGHTKTVEYIGNATGLEKVRVLQEGDKLDANGLVEKHKDSKTKLTVYTKNKFYAKTYKKVLELAEHPKKIKKLVTKRNPAGGSGTTIRIIMPAKTKIKEVFVDDLFSEVRKISTSTKIKLPRMYEKKLKLGIQKIIGQSGTFKDWGGERSDLYSTKMLLNGKRIPTAIAFKGRATTGELTPEKMGKRGTQIIRLFEEPAQLFLVVYEGSIGSYLKSQMQASALSHAMAGQKIYYGVIDADDMRRLRVAYPDAFQ
ncbi:MAG: hypothetical protein Q7R48_02835 [bacterium]|nr:hypothetical protein [bacterium]